MDEEGADRVALQIETRQDQIESVRVQSGRRQDEGLEDVFCVLSQRPQRAVFLRL